MELSIPDVAGVLVGFILTLAVFSYLLGDNGLFRLALHIFTGVAAGFAAVAAWYSVIWPQVVLRLLEGSPAERLWALIPLGLSLLLLAKASPRLAGLGSLALALMVGVGAATAIGGAVLGTIFPQSLAAMDGFDVQALAQAGEAPFAGFLNALLVLVGTVATLAYFQFGARAHPDQPPRRTGWMEGLASIGQAFIAVAFGALFAGVFSAALAAFVDRWTFIVDLIRPLIQ